MAILNLLLGGFLVYLVTFGFKDREPPTVSIKFPTNGYEFRSFKKILDHSWENPEDLYVNIKNQVQISRFQNIVNPNNFQTK